MNSRDEIMSRLLGLFPKQSIRESFRTQSQRKEELLTEVVEHSNDDDILEFTRINTGYTKQHVYIMNQDVSDFNNMPEHILTENTKKTVSDTAIEYFDLYDVIYQVYLQQPVEMVPLEFKWPIKILISNGLTVVYFTILEKNIQAYFENRNVVTTKKSIDENSIISLIVSQLGSYGPLGNCDLNKGIKELWKRDIVDAIEVQYLRSRSTAKETMHEEYTFKQVYPEDYEKALQSPLIKVLFKFLKDADKYCDHFTIEPTLGKITFPTFLKEREHSQNVIRKILEFN